MLARLPQIGSLKPIKLPLGSFSDVHWDFLAHPTNLSIKY